MPGLDWGAVAASLADGVLEALEGFREEHPLATCDKVVVQVERFDGNGVTVFVTHDGEGGEHEANLSDVSHAWEMHRLAIEDLVADDEDEGRVLEGLGEPDDEDCVWTDEHPTFVRLGLACLAAATKVRGHEALSGVRWTSGPRIVVEDEDGSILDETWVALFEPQL